VSALEEAVFERLAGTKRPSTMGGEEREKGRLYFHLYTVPLLESAGLLEDDRWQEAVFWGAVQLCLGLHIRYADYIMDGDKVCASIPRLTKQAHGYLARAQSLLWSKGHAWSPEQTAIYGQYIDYECELEAGCFHDFSSLWRRVSPLCVVGETYLSSSMGSLEFRWNYRKFLAWSLIHADCDDVLEDLAANRKTPVTILARERITNHSTDLAATSEVVRALKAFQAKQAERLLHSVSDPVWQTVIRKLVEAFAETI
jgi:hypothetical protein